MAVSIDRKNSVFLNAPTSCQKRSILHNAARNGCISTAMCQQHTSAPLVSYICRPDLRQSELDIPAIIPASYLSDLSLHELLKTDTATLECTIDSCSTPLTVIQECEVTEI